MDRKISFPEIIDGIGVMCAYDELRDIVEFVPNPRNPNKHSDRQVEVLARIIKSQGWRAPITVSTRSGFIVRGHGRLLAAQKLGFSMCQLIIRTMKTRLRNGRT